MPQPAWLETHIVARSDHVDQSDERDFFAVYMAMSARLSSLSAKPGPLSTTVRRTACGWPCSSRLSEVRTQTWAGCCAVSCAMAAKGRARASAAAIVVGVTAVAMDGAAAAGCAGTAAPAPAAAATPEAAAPPDAPTGATADDALAEGLVEAQVSVEGLRQELAKVGAPIGWSNEYRAVRLIDGKPDRRKPLDASQLDDEGRVRELSRMMAGVDESDSALAHARELLEAARVGG